MKTILSLLIAGLIGCTVSQAADATAPVETPSPKIELTPEGPMNLGTVFQGEKRHIEFKLTNKTDKAITIAKIRSSCPCTETDSYPKEPIAPGATAQVTLWLFADRLAEGPFERSVLVQMDNSPVPAVALHFSGTRLSAISFSPSPSVKVPYVPAPNSGWERKVQISGNFPDGKRLVLGAPVPSVGVSADLKETAPSKYDLMIRAKVPQKMGEFSEEVKLPVVEPAGMPAAVVRVKGQVGQKLDVSPHLLALPGDATGAITKKIRVSYRTPIAARAHFSHDAAPALEKVPPQKISSKDLKIVVPPGISANPSDANDAVVILVTFSKDVLKSNNRGIITIAGPDASPIKVDFVVVPPLSER